MKLVPLIAALAISLASTAPAAAKPLQCAPYARANSGIDLHGNAATWWTQAQNNYERGQAPRAGSVLVFKPTGAMRVGHVAVVRKIVDERHVVLNHANWSRPGMIETSAMAEDVSAKGDWSSVRVWYAPTRSLGLRASPAFGFIYAPGSGGRIGGGSADSTGHAGKAAETAPVAPTHQRFEMAFADFPARN